MYADDAQSAPADGEHFVRRREHPQQRFGDELEERAADAHDADGREDCQADGLAHAVEFLRAVVVRHDGHHRVVEAEARHEDEALELEVSTEHRGRRLGERDENFVHAEHHHRADGLHDDRRNADGVDVRHRRAVGTDVLEVDLHLGIFLEVQEKAEARADELADDRGDRRARDLHAGKAQKAENQNRVEHDVAHRARDLRDHRKVRPPRGLEQALAVNLQEQSERAADADHHIITAVGNDLRVFRLEAKKRRGERKAEDSKDGGGAERQEKSRARGAVDRLHVLFTQRTREQRVHTDARAHGERDAQRLQRESERHGVHCVLTEPRDEHAVDNVVERLKEHRYHHGPRHVGQQLADGHRAHLVFSGIFFHVSSLLNLFVPTYKIPAPQRRNQSLIIFSATRAWKKFISECKCASNASARSTLQAPLKNVRSTFLNYFFSSPFADFVRYALMKPSRSPSMTDWMLPVS